jgi:hypothetical protein
MIPGFFLLLLTTHRFALSHLAFYTSIQHSHVSKKKLSVEEIYLLMSQIVAAKNSPDL